MEKLTLREHLDDIHFYTQSESAIKVIIWWAAWLGGVRLAICANNVESKTLGGAFLFFSLALLMEFLEKKRKYRIGRFLHTIFCITCGTILIGGLNLLLCENDFIPVKWLYNASYGILLFLTLDTVVNSIVGDDFKKNDSSPSGNINNDHNELIQVFMERAEKGNLGNAGGN